MAATDSAPSADRNPVEILAEEFAERHRRGERPSLTEYTRRYPELAEEIRDLFPALVAMEKLKPPTDDATGDFLAGGGPGTPMMGEAIGQMGEFRLLREVGAGAWASFTRRCKSRWAATSRSRSSPARGG